jgi:transposase
MQKYKKIQQVSKELGIGYKTMLQWSRENGELDSAQRKKNDTLSMESVQEVSDFFIEPYISVNNPEKKRVGIDLRPKHFLNMSKKTAYETFRKENKSVKISESKFRKLLFP